MKSAPLFEFTQDALNRLLPLHLIVTAQGTITNVGPTLARIFGDRITDAALFDVFTVLKPRNLRRIEDLFDRVGEKLALSAQPDDGDPVQFRCFATPLGADRLIIDFSFGANMADALSRFQLSGRDFKPNDLSVDLVYTFETQRTLLEDSQKMAAALMAAKEQAEHKAYIDSVTGLANRWALHRALRDILQGPEDQGDFALLHIDLDRFKTINDCFGHAAGDAVLQHTGMAIKTYAKAADLPVRVGGDEFALIVTDAPGDLALIRLAEDLRDAISTPIRFEATLCQVGASIGILRFRPDATMNSDILVHNSDIALYHAKETGNAVQLLTPAMIQQRLETAVLTEEIETGVTEGQFVPFFQPQINTQTGTIHGFETLVRWRHPERGILAPDRFLDTARRANLLDEIDRQVQRRAMAAFTSWPQPGQGARPFKLSFNITTSLLRSGDFIETLQDELMIAGLSSESIQLELLESILFDTADHVLYRQCQGIIQAGFTLALDDFGTGHAAISTLIEAPISMLKIDRSFVTGLDCNPKLRLITGSMLAMARELGLEVLAEGVETQGELDLLQGNGCHLFQGYFFSRPLDAAAVPHWIEAWDRPAARAAG